MTFSFDGKRVLVTGASSGIGRAMVVELAHRGAHCIALARRIDLLEDLQNEIVASGIRKPEILVEDLLTPQGLANAKNAIQDVDVLINNAGFGMNGRFLSSNKTRADSMFRLNFVIPILLSQEAAKFMKLRESAAIMNVASIAGMVPTPFHGAYSATKAGLLNFTAGIHAELKPHGIHVTALCPGVTDTEFFDAGHYETKSFVYRLKRLSPQRVAQDGLLALARNKVVVVPGYQTKCLIAVTKILPRTWVTKLSGWAMSTD